MDVLRQDIRYAVRSLRRGRFIAAITVLTLSLGIGVVTALFAVTDAVLLQPIVAGQGRVVVVSKRDSQRDNFPHSLSFPEFIAWRDQSRSFEVLAAVDHAATGSVALGIDRRTFPVQTIGNIRAVPR